MAKSKNEQNTLRKLNRLELIEIIYALRKDNLALEKKCLNLQSRIAAMKLKHSQDKERENKLMQIEQLLHEMHTPTDSHAAEEEAWPENQE